MLLMSVISMFTQNLSIPDVYADEKEHNHSLINEISDKVVSGDTSKAAIEQILQQIQTQITQRSGQEKATAALKQIRSLIELNPNGTLSQSILSLAKQQASGNIAAVNQTAVQIATFVASGGDYVGQPLQQSGASSPVTAASSPSSSSPVTAASSLSSSSSSSPVTAASSLSSSSSSSPVTAASSPVTAASSSPVSAASSPVTAASSPVTAASSPVTAA